VYSRMLEQAAAAAYGRTEDSVAYPDQAQKTIARVTFLNAGPGKRAWSDF